MTSGKNQVETPVRTTLSPASRALWAFVAPLLGGLFLTYAATQLTAGLTDTPMSVVPFWAGLGLTSLFMGMRWYGLPEMGLRGKRPLFSSISFAVLGWVALLIFRFVFISILGLDSGFDEFFYRLLFEGLCLHIWTFGLLFRSLADWRGGLTAAMGSGILFGLVAALLFREAPDMPAPASLVYFLLWGIFYGIIRLRSGSLLGASLIQAIQSFSTWVVLTPNLALASNNFTAMYLATSLAYFIFIWRLWPKQEEDYRV